MSAPATRLVTTSGPVLACGWDGTLDAPVGDVFLAPDGVICKHGRLIAPGRDGATEGQQTEPGTLQRPADGAFI
ncbi:hypothetical protein HPB47_023444 [Ixodes persulcatus]|uniref:Uncharacterized protein n=1 Tax=Ixodes persulcatus TaxID=34615 RepID=A0AC60Q8U5_IXOPE|nr:hypothetical protein HPB47_023444 [Ixodes persulcatus]